jgi:hypothetical protein
MLLRCHRLIAKEDDLVFMKSLANVIDDHLGEIGREIDSADLGSDGCSEAFDLKVVPSQLSETSPFVCEVKDWPDPLTAKGLAIFGDVRTRVFAGDDVGMRSRRCHKSPLDSSF